MSGLYALLSGSLSINDSLAGGGLYISPTGTVFGGIMDPSILAGLTANGTLTGPDANGIYTFTDTSGDVSTVGPFGTCGNTACSNTTCSGQCTISYTATDGESATVGIGISGNTLTPAGGLGGGIYNGGALSLQCVAVSGHGSVEAEARLAFSKTADTESLPELGQEITYTFTVTNNGLDALADVLVTDPLFGSDPVLAIPTLGPGATQAVTMGYTVAQADIDAGTISNTATAEATPVCGAVLTAISTCVVGGENPGTTNTPGEGNTFVDLTQSDALNGGGIYGAAGATTTLLNTGIYNNSVSNDGGGIYLEAGSNLSITGSEVINNVAGADGGGIFDADLTYGNLMTDVFDVFCGNLASKAYYTTQALANEPCAVSIWNNAVNNYDINTTGLEVDYPCCSSPNTDSPLLALAKTPSRTSVTAAGQQVTYTFTVTNNDVNPILGFQISDPLLGEGVVASSSVPLLPGASTQVTGIYTVTQADMDSGQIANTATATGTPLPGGNPPTATGSSTVTASQQPELSVDKSSDVETITAAGQEITYSFAVENTGNVTLTGVTVNDPLLGDSPVGTIASLAPGVTRTVTAVYTVTQADMDEGSIANTAAVTGTPPNGLEPPTATNSDTVTAGQTAELEFDKVASPTSVANIGDTITYTLMAKNTGNVTLTNVVISDPMLSDSALATVTSLAPGASYEKTVQYTVTQADILAGTIVNTATATGTPPEGLTPPTVSSDVTVPATQTSAIDLSKVANLSVVDEADTEITYTITAKNTGNIPLANVVISDPMFGGTLATIASLLPGASQVVTPSYTVTQSDIDNGAAIENTATVTGVSTLDNSTVTKTSDTEVPISQNAKISLNKTAAQTTFSHVGDIINYTFEVENTGNVTLTDVTLTDANPQVTLQPLPATTLAPGQKVTTVGTYTVTQSDVTAGTPLSNTATVQGIQPNGESVLDIGQSTVGGNSNASVITGTVFNDTNLNGLDDGGEPGIPGVYVALCDTSGNILQKTVTDSNGFYSFGNVPVGNYTLYETVTDPGTTLPNTFPQPSGFNASDTPRALNVAVPTTGLALNNNNFGHSNGQILLCTDDLIQFHRTSTATTSDWANIDVVSGASTYKGTFAPDADINGIGWNPVDDFLYGWDMTTKQLVRVDNNMAVTQLGVPTGLPLSNYITGTFDDKGLLYIWAPTATDAQGNHFFYAVCLDQSSPNYLKLVNPDGSLQSAPYGMGYSQPAGLAKRVYMPDWVYYVDPTDGKPYLYGVSDETGNMYRICVASPTGPYVFEVMTTTGPTNALSYGAMGVDSQGNIYAICNELGQMYRYNVSGLSATSELLSVSNVCLMNDGTMCPRARVDLPVPIACTTTMIQFYKGASDTSSTWVDINLVTGKETTRGTFSPDANINAITYNNLDGLIYGWDSIANQFVRIDNNMNISYLGVPTGIPTFAAGQYFWAGASTIDGTFYIFTPDLKNSTLYALDIDPSSPNYMKLINPDRSLQTGTYGIPINAAATALANIADWVYLDDPDTGIPYLYFVNRNGATGSGYLCRINLQNGNLTTLDTTAPSYNSFYGAMGADADGNIYAINNGTGNIVRYTVSGNTATGEVFSTTASSSNNDGAMCQTAAIRLDFGDAPDLGAGNGAGNYNTLLANNGPRHQVLPLNALTLGTQITSEGDANQNATATGDGGDDGVASLPDIHRTDGTYTVTVTATNNTNTPANLYGWIDFDQDGLFEPGEIATTRPVVPANSGTQTYPLTFNVPGTAPLGTTFARFRLTTDALALGADSLGQDTGSVGAASDGEVEDYAVTMAPLADLAITENVDNSKPNDGDTVTYTINIQNNGPDTAATPTFTDTIPSQLENVMVSTDGTTWQPFTGTLNLTDLPNGSHTTLYVKGTVGESVPPGSFDNPVSVAGPTTDPNLSNNSANVPVTVQAPPYTPSADLQVTITSDKPTYDPGDPILYTVKVRNFGPDTSVAPVLTDNFPSVVGDIYYSTDNGNTWNPYEEQINLPDLPSDSETTILFKGIVAEGTPPSIIPDTISVKSPVTLDPNPDNNQDDVDVAVVDTADLSLAKTAKNDTVTAGTQITYELTVSNAGPGPATNATITDQLPSTIENPQYSLDNGATWNGWAGQVNVGTLAVNAAKTVLIAGNVQSSALGYLTNTAKVTSDVPDENPNNDTPTVTTPITALADVTIEKTASKGHIDSTNPGSPSIIYTLKVSNAGPSDAHNIQVVDNLPSQLTNGKFSLNGGATWNPWTGSTSIGSLAAGASNTVLISADWVPDTTGTIENTATIKTPTPSPNPPIPSTVQTPIDEASHLVVVKTVVNPQEVYLDGDPVTYNISVANTGPVDALDTTLTDVIPAALKGPVTYGVDGGPSQPWGGSLDLGTVEVGQQVNVTLSAFVNTASIQSIPNTVTAVSRYPNPVPDDGTSKVYISANGAANLSIVKNLLTHPVVAGTPVNYTIVVSNAGPDDALDVVVTDQLDADLLNAQYSYDNVDYLPYGDAISLGTIAAQTSVTLYFKGGVDPSAANSEHFNPTLSNTATVSSSTPPTDVDPRTSNNVVEPIVPSADVSVVKTTVPADLSLMVAGTTITYQLTVTNNGPSEAEEVVVVDAIPASIITPEYAMSPDGPWSTWGGHLLIGDMPVGQSTSVYIQGTISRALVDGTTETPILSNTATILSATPDPVPANNTSTISGPVYAQADLQAVKTLYGQNTATVGQTVTYIMKVLNSGSSNAENVMMVDSIPEGLTNVQYSLDSGLTWNPWDGSFAVPLLGAGTGRSILIQGTAAKNQTGLIGNSAAMLSTTKDPNPNNNTIRVDVPYTNVDLTVAKVPDVPVTVVGNTITYDITVCNNGDEDAPDTQYQDIMDPTSFAGIQYSMDGGVTWQDWPDDGTLSLGTLPAGTCTAFKMRGVVQPHADDGVDSTPTVSSGTTTANTTVFTPLLDLADLSLEKSVSPEVAGVGDTVTYTFTITNHGPGHADDYILYDPVDPQLAGMEYSTDGGATWSAWTGSYEWGAPDSESHFWPGMTATILLRGTLTNQFAGNYHNTAVVSSTTADPDPSNNVGTATVTDDTVILTVTKVPDVPFTVVGDTINYTVTVCNNGAADAVNTMYQDIPTEASGDIQFSFDGGLSWQDWPTGNVLALGTLVAGTCTTFLTRSVVQPHADDGVDYNPVVTSGKYTGSTTVFTPLVDVADLEITKTSSTTMAKVGDVITYQLTVHNHGSGHADDYVFIDQVEPQLANPEYSLDSGNSWIPWTGSYEWGAPDSESHFWPGMMASILLRGTVTDSFEGVYANTAFVTSTSADPDPTNNYSTYTVTVPNLVKNGPSLTPTVDISVTQTADKKCICPCQSIIYRIQVANLGTGPAQNVVVADDLPNSLRCCAGYSLDGGRTWKNWTGTLQLGELPANGLQEIQIKVTPPRNWAKGVEHKVYAFSDNCDANPSNNFSSLKRPYCCQKGCSCRK